MNSDLKWIKKHYSEKMMHLCRKYFPSLLETPGLLPNLLKENFYNHSCLADDIISEMCEESFKNFIYSKIDVEKREKNVIKNPFELMKEAGYTLYKCETVEETEKFKQYYQKNELLCSFNDMYHRLNKSDIFFAVKDNIDEIERSSAPKRQDEYGTSVISIQFSKGNYNDVSIKNRYNHTVNNPDATFSNNLDNIIEGLTSSFEKEYGYNINNSVSSCFELEHYVLGPDDRYYKFNVEIGDIYFCPDNIFLEDDDVCQYEKEKYILMENYLLDLQGKRVINIDPTEIAKDYAFPESFRNIQKVLVEKQENGKKITLTNNFGIDNIIILNNNNEIINVSLPTVEKLGDNFLRYNEKLEQINIPKLRQVGNYFLSINEELKEIDMPKLYSIGGKFLYSNNRVNNVNLPNAQVIADHFLYSNSILKNIDLPMLQSVGGHFLYSDNMLENINLPNVEIIGDSFLECNESLVSISLPNVKMIDYGFMFSNNALKSIELPKVETIESRFLYTNNTLEQIDLPNIKSMGYRCLINNRFLRDTIEDLINYNLNNYSL